MASVLQASPDTTQERFSPAPETWREGQVYIQLNYPFKPAYKHKDALKFYHNTGHKSSGHEIVHPY